MPIKYRRIPPLSDTDIARFWSLIDRRAPDECWPWKGRRHKRGYGFFDTKTERGLRATRVLIVVVTGKDPSDKEACHSCDNPPCCNPDHVSTGTHQKNMRDARDRGRVTVLRGPDHYLYGKHPNMPTMSFHPGRDLAGEKHPLSKLKDSQVIEIRNSWSAGGTTKSELSRKFLVSRKLIRMIIEGKTWKHLLS